MKSLFLTLALVLSCPAVFGANEELKELQKKHRAERHEENKKWKAMEEECYTKYPRGHDTKHADYDASFKCREEINDVKNAFEEKQQEELCQKLNLGCKKKAFN